MTKEIEIRAIVKDKVKIEKKLMNFGFIQKSKTEQIDIMLDYPDGRLFNSGQKIRIRTEDGKSELTYKGNFEGEGDVSRRKELNIAIDSKDTEKLISLMDSLGFPVLFLIPKTRVLYENKGIKVTFDEWPIIGNMMEIEGEEKKIKELAVRLCPDIEFKNYRLKELFLEEEKKSGKSIIELQKEYEQKNKFKLGNLTYLLS